MATEPISPPEGGPVLPFPPQVLGIATVALVVVSLTAYGLYLTVAGGTVNTDVVQIGGGLFGLGITLVAWDGLVAYFEELRR